MVHKPLLTAHATPDYKPDDLEAAVSASRRKPRFKDIVHAAVQNDFHGQLKRKLKDGVDRDELEKYRKSVSELKEIKDKKVRAFYEQQNERLNDWLEVDTLVMSMANDVLDSMNPQDADGDGVAEIGGALKTTKGNIDPLLPEDEREKIQYAVYDLLSPGMQKYLGGLEALHSSQIQADRAHDIAETLQYCLEGLSEVDRAFVSVDYTSQGPTGHAEG